MKRFFRTSAEVCTCALVAVVASAGTAWLWTSQLFVGAIR